MSDDKADTYTVSFKSGEHYGASLVVVRGNTPDELKENIKALNAKMLTLVVETENLLHATYSLTGEGVDKKSKKDKGGKQEESDGGSVSAIRTCEHGKRTRREGTGARGPWVGYFCPRPRGAQDQCKPIFEDN